MVTNTSSVGYAPFGIAVNPNTNLIYVTTMSPPSQDITGYISVMDGSTNSVIATVNTGNSPTIGVAVNPTIGLIYATSANNSVIVINSPTNNIITKLILGGNPCSVAVNPVTNRIYVANSMSDSVTVINGLTSSIVDKVNVGIGPCSIAVNPSTNRIYVVNGLNKTISVLDGSTSSILTTINMEKSASSIAVNPGSNLIYVVANPTISNPLSPSSVLVYNGSTNNLIVNVSVGNSISSIAVNPHTNLIYATDQNSYTLLVINGSTNGLEATVNVGPEPTDVAINPETNMIYVANYIHSVSVINGYNNSVVDTINVGFGLNSIAVNPAANRIYAISHDSNKALVINGYSNSVATSVTVGIMPSDIAVNSSTGFAYVANSAEDTISIVQENLVSSTTQLSSSLSPSINGKSVNFTAKVTGVGSVPMGAVTFLDRGIQIASTICLNSSEEAIFSTSNLSPGNHIITAIYSGDAIFSGSAGTLLQNISNVSKIAFITSAQTTVAGSTSSLITIQTQDTSGNPAMFGSNVDLNLTSTSNNSKFDIAAIGPFDGSVTKITVPGNNDIASFYYRDIIAGNPTITVSNTSYFSCTQQETVTAAASSQIRVESAADGSGSLAPDQNVAIGSSLTIYGITRDQYGNYTGSPANAAWSLTAKTGSVVDTDLIASGNGKSAVFTGYLAGTAIINASITGLTSIGSGTINVPAPVISYPSGGGGGGGGGSPPPVIKTLTLSGFTSAADLKIDSYGNVQSAAQLTSDDGNVTLAIPKSAKLVDANGKALDTLSASFLTSVSELPPTQTVILTAYDFGPDGAQFSPSLILTLKYDPQSLPSSMNGNKISLAFWDGSKWVSVESMQDTTINTITAQISHFSEYALLAELAPAKFTLSDLKITEDKSNPDDPVTIQIVVSNEGGCQGKYTANLTLNSFGIDKQEITLYAGKTETVSFTLKNLIPGKYSVAINDKTDQFTVAGPSGVIPEKPQALEPQAAPSTPFSTDAPITPFTPKTQVPSQEKKVTFPLTWLIISIVVILALAVGIILVKRKNKHEES